MEDFEIEVVQEIWRLPDLTLNIFYATNDIAVIKGLRGVFNKERRIKITEILRNRKFKILLFERKRDNERLNYQLDLEDPNATFKKI